MSIRLRMRTTTEIKRTLARVANMALNGEIDTKVANTVILACNAILGVLFGKLNAAVSIRLKRVFQST